MSFHFVRSDLVSFHSVEGAATPARASVP